MINIRFVFLLVLLTNRLSSMEKIAGPLFEFCANTVVTKILGNKVPEEINLVREFSTMFKDKGYCLAAMTFLQQLEALYPQHEWYLENIRCFLSIKLMWPEIKTAYQLVTEENADKRQFEKFLVQLGLSIGISIIHSVGHGFIQIAGLNNLDYNCQYFPLK